MSHSLTCSAPYLSTVSCLPRPAMKKMRMMIGVNQMMIIGVMLMMMMIIGVMEKKRDDGDEPDDDGMGKSEGLICSGLIWVKKIYMIACSEEFDWDLTGGQNLTGDLTGEGGSAHLVGPRNVAH